MKPRNFCNASTSGHFDHFLKLFVNTAVSIKTNDPALSTFSAIHIDFCFSSARFLSASLCIFSNSHLLFSNFSIKPVSSILIDTLNPKSFKSLLNFFTISRTFSFS